MSVLAFIGFIIVVSVIVFYTFIIKEEGVVIRLSSQTGYVWDAYVGIRPLRSGINNVSDLQHLLFGLEINHEMEV